MKPQWQTYSLYSFSIAENFILTWHSSMKSYWRKKFQLCLHYYSSLSKAGWKHFAHEQWLPLQLEQQTHVFTLHAIRLVLSVPYFNRLSVGVLRHTLFTLEKILSILSFLTSLPTVHNFSHVDLVCCWNVFITDYLCARFSVYLLGLETDISLRHRCFESQNQLCNMNRKPII